MSETTETKEVTGMTEAEQVSAARRNTRGLFVGVASTGDSIKARWRSEGKGFSLKAFARKLAKEDDSMAKDWLAHKLGSLNLKRSDKNLAEASLAAQATKNAKTKTKK